MFLIIILHTVRDLEKHKCFYWYKANSWGKILFNTVLSVSDNNKLLIIIKVIIYTDANNTFF